jgi:hypothetical protein
MNESSGLQSAVIVVQAWAVGLSNWFISALPSAVLVMSAVLTALQLYVFVRDQVKKRKE